MSEQEPASGGTADGNAAGPEAGSQVEVAHEALIRNWPRLRGWLETDRVGLRLRQEVGDAARAWEEQGRVDGFLAHDESPRFETVDALEREHRLPLSGLERAYVEACREVRQRRVAEAEARRQRQLVVTRRWLVAVSVMLVAALIASVFAWNQQSEADSQASKARNQESTAVAERDNAATAQAEAERQARVAQSRQLAAQSSEQMDRQLDLALLLGVEAFNVADTVEARRELLTGLHANPRLTTSLRGHDGPVSGLALSADGSTLASIGADGSLILWDVTNRRRRGEARTVFTGGVTKSAFSPDGTILAFGSSDGMIRLWDVTDGRLLDPPIAGHPWGVDAIAFSPDGKTIASGHSDSTVILWDVASRQQLGPTLDDPDFGTMMSVAFSPDGKTLVTGSSSGSVVFWDLA
jgi:hypothetical protein